MLIVSYNWSFRCIQHWQFLKKCSFSSSSICEKNTSENGPCLLNIIYSLNHLFKKCYQFQYIFFQGVEVVGAEVSFIRG